MLLLPFSTFIERGVQLQHHRLSALQQKGSQQHSDTHGELATEKGAVRVCCEGPSFAAVPPAVLHAVLPAVLLGALPAAPDWCPHLALPSRPATQLINNPTQQQPTQQQAHPVSHDTTE